MDGWQPPKLISWNMRRRAGEALRAYNQAEDRFRQIQGERDALEERKQLLLKRWTTMQSSGPPTHEDSVEAENEFLLICGRLQALLLPWQTAHLALVSAYDEVQAVLRAAGFTVRLDS